MAAASTPNLAYPPPAPRASSPTLKGFKKVFSGRRRSSEASHDSAPNGRTSIDSTTLNRSPTARSAHSSPDRERSSKSSHGGVAKLIPGHSKRVRERNRESEIQAIIDEPIQRGRSPKSVAPSPPGTAVQNRSQTSLLTDGSENDTPPPLLPRDSHTGFFTTSSPLIKSKTIDDGIDRILHNDNLPSAPSVEAFPVILEPPRNDGGDVSPSSPKLNLDSAPVLLSPTLMDKADTLGVDYTPGRRGSISKLRAKSPARKIRNVFSRSARSPATSPERASVTAVDIRTSPNSSQTSIAERRFGENSERSAPSPLKSSSATSIAEPSSPRRLPTLETEVALPQTPPGARLITPSTTVTPPTPTDTFRDQIVASPKMVEDTDQDHVSEIQSPAEASTNALGHRRVRSASSATHHKSKLSTSMTVPLTPTIEDHNKSSPDKPTGGRNFTGNSGFFSSWVSAAQNAATTITNLTAQNRSRAGTDNSQPVAANINEEKASGQIEADEKEKTKRQLAVETLGSGNLDFSHLGLDATVDDKASLSSRPDLSSFRKKSDLRKDEAHAKQEDILAKRAVSAAYEDGGENTPVAEIPDPLGSIRHATNLENATSGTLTPPNGSILEGDQPVKRSNSVRSKLANRRSRGSSIATGQSVAGTVVASTTTLVNAPSGSRMAGFTAAPKQRNRAFHQQFRSVPEDDNLIEDYSCALQKEILLAGRIYISEGHICFSSNILGWVTTLIISFEEIVSVERENTAMIIPNAIAIQTLHARHTFRSLLSREATFDLMIGIWKVNHPASFSKSVNGKQMIAEQARHDAEKALGTKAADEAESEGSSDESSGSDGDDDDDDSAPSFVGSSASVTGSDVVVDTKSVTRKPSGTVAVAPPTNGTAPSSASPEIAATAAVVAGVPGAVVDYPGPATHGPTECTDSATHYDKIIKDEVIPAPLGKIYSLLYGSQSGVFLRKYLVDECKCLDLVLDDDKKGLSNETKTRQYSYIKPLGGSIGPKQTKCITTESLDFFDLEKSLSVTCTTQTPDVPSGSAFSTKTRYCLTWAPGNATRLQMNCTIEWTAKSWLKGPIEKGANDGQQQYGDGLIKAIKAALGRSRGATVSSKGAKGKRKRKGEKRSKSEQPGNATQKSKDWGVFEPLRSTLEPVVNIIEPVMKMELIVGILTIMMFILWFGGNRGMGRQVGNTGSPLNHMERIAAYEHLWHREENDLWEWLENRAGVDRVILGGSADTSNDRAGQRYSSKNRAKALKDKSMAARLQAEKWSRKEMQEAVRVTRERLEEMQRALDEKVV